MIKLTVSPSLKGELVLSAIRGKLRPGTTLEISDEVANDADVLWARRKGYISFDSDNSGSSGADHVSSADEVEFTNAMKGSVTVPFLGRTISPGGRFILKHGDKNMDKAQKMVAAGYLKCAPSISADSVRAQVPVSDAEMVSKKGSGRSKRRKKKADEAQQSAEIFGIMNTEVS